MSVQSFKGDKNIGEGFVAPGYLRSKAGGVLVCRLPTATPNFGADPIPVLGRSGSVDCHLQPPHSKRSMPSDVEGVVTEIPDEGVSIADDQRPRSQATATPSEDHSALLDQARHLRKFGAATKNLESSRVAIRICRCSHEGVRTSSAALLEARAAENRAAPRADRSRQAEAEDRSSALERGSRAGQVALRVWALAADHSLDDQACVYSHDGAISGGLVPWFRLG